MHPGRGARETPDPIANSREERWHPFRVLRSPEYTVVSQKTLDHRLQAEIRDQTELVVAIGPA
jgi:hypothetical protein